MPIMDDPSIQRVIDSIANNSKNFSSADLLFTLATARRGKPARLDDVSRKVQALYGGRSRLLIEKALQERFPNTENMPKQALTLMKSFARADAGVYAKPADRWLDDADGKRVDGDAAKLWAWALKKARFGPRMQEVERRTLIPPGGVFGEVVYEKLPGDKIGQPYIHLYWPHDVEVLCHWQASTRWQFKWMVALRQAPPIPTTMTIDPLSASDPLSTAMAPGAVVPPTPTPLPSVPREWWKVYSRTPPDSIDGTWGPWSVAFSSTHGESAKLQGGPQKYEGQMAPVFYVQPVDPEGSVFGLVDEDLIDVVLGLNVQRNDEIFTLERQGHSQLWTDDQTELAVIKTGPDTISKVGSGKTLQAINYTPALNEARESRRMMLREVAISRGNSPHAYDDTGSVPSSGIAKKIENVMHDNRVAESADLFQVIEEEEPLAVLHDVISTFHPDRAKLKGTTPRMQARRAPVLEDLSQKQQRLERAADRGWITEPRAATEAELYDTEANAEERMKAIEAAAPPPPPPPPPGDPLNMNANRVVDQRAAGAIPPANPPPPPPPPDLTGQNNT